MKQFKKPIELNDYINNYFNSISKIDLGSLTITHKKNKEDEICDEKYLAYIIFNSNEEYLKYKQNPLIQIDYDFHTINTIRAYINISEFVDLKMKFNIDFIEVIDENLLVTPTDVTVGGVTYTDQMNWAGRLSGIQDAWNRGFTGKGVKVGVIDGNFTEGLPNVPLTKVMFAEVEPSVEKYDQHGTHSASALGSPLNNGVSVGMAPECSVYGLNVDFSISKVLEALQWCLDNNMDIISMSFTTSYFVQSWKTLLEEAERRDIIAVAGGGNSVTDGTIYPGALPCVLAIGAITLSTNESFSNYGHVLAETTYNNQPWIDFVYSCVNIPVSDSKGNLYMYGGTSGATPSIAGFVACLKEEFPDWTKDQIVAHMKQHSFPVIDRFGVFPYYHNPINPPNIGAVARITSDGKLLLKGSLEIDSDLKTRFFSNGNASTGGVIDYDWVEGVSISGTDIRCKNIIPNSDLT